MPYDWCKVALHKSCLCIHYKVSCFNPVMNPTAFHDFARLRHRSGFVAVMIIALAITHGLGIGNNPASTRVLRTYRSIAFQASFERPLAQLAAGERTKCKVYYI